MPTVTITAVADQNNGYTHLVSFTHSNGAEGICKAWNGTVEKAKWVVGEQADVEFEDRPDKRDPNKSEKFIKPAYKGRTGGGGGGGQAKSDPVKNALIKEANENNNATIGYASHLKAATACWEMAVQLLGPGAGVNEVRAVAMDISTGIRETASIFGGRS